MPEEISSEQRANACEDTLREEKKVRELPDDRDSYRKKGSCERKKKRKETASRESYIYFFIISTSLFISLNCRLLHLYVK